MRSYSIQSFSQDKRVAKVILWTVFFSFLAHGFSWFNVAFNHDSLKVFQLDGNWQASLGRFLIPVYLLLRGKIVAPLLVAFLSVLFLSLSVALTVRLLDIKRTLSIVLVSGLFATCQVLTSLYSTYMPAADIQMLSLLFSVLSVCLIFDRRKYLMPAAVVSLAISIALYQAYAQVFLVLAILRLTKDLADKGTSGVLWKNGAYTVLCFVCGALLYYVGWVVYVRIVFGSGISQLPSYGAYNSVGRIGSISLQTIPGLIKGAYFIFLKYVLRPEGMNSFFIGIVHFLLAAGSFYFLSIKIRSISSRAWAALMMLLLPLAANFVYILTGGVRHTLMYFSFIVLFAGVVMSLEIGMAENSKVRHPRLDKIISVAMTTLLILLVWNNVVYANQVHVRKSLEEQATLSVMTRIIDKIEQVEGYEPGKTEVVFVGNLDKSEVKQNREGYNARHVIGDYVNFSVTYLETLSDYFKYYLGYPINVAGRDTAVYFSKMPEVAEMPAFPSPGFADMIGDKLVVKLSDNMIIMESKEFHSSLSAD
ncbi:MAG: glucosyltransferase domain-containing protein [Bacteroidales bacterium]|nr:glucosyltransferase domain-containing protein [Bacteroidales bacterium]